MPASAHEHDRCRASLVRSPARPSDHGTAAGWAGGGANRDVGTDDAAAAGAAAPMGAGRHRPRAGRERPGGARHAKPAARAAGRPAGAHRSRLADLRALAPRAGAAAGAQRIRGAALFLYAAALCRHRARVTARAGRFARSAGAPARILRGVGRLSRGLHAGGLPGRPGRSWSWWTGRAWGWRLRSGWRHVAFRRSVRRPGRRCAHAGTCRAFARRGRAGRAGRGSCTLCACDCNYACAHAWIRARTWVGARTWLCARTRTRGGCTGSSASAQRADGGASVAGRACTGANTGRRCARSGRAAAISGWRSGCCPAIGRSAHHVALAGPCAFRAGRRVAAGTHRPASDTGSAARGPARAGRRAATGDP